METPPKTPEEEAKSSPKKENADLDEEGGELKGVESVKSVGRRFVKWTSEDLFDFNPEYGRSIRGILTLLELIVSALVMIMVGSGCKLESNFSCHSSAAFTFVVASSAFTQNALLVFCCLLSKKGDAIIRSAVLELLYYFVYCIFYLIAGLVLEANLSNNDFGHHAILAGGIFGLTNCVLYLLSAIWSFLYFRKHFGGRDEE